MSVIDERVLQMRFDNSQFESGVQTSLGTLDKLKSALNMGGAAKGLEEINAASRAISFDGLYGAVDSIGTKFSAMEQIAIGALRRIGSQVAQTAENFVKALTIQPVTTGFNEYELKMGSVQTIMASTGASLEEVNGYLEELNKYSDQTIYSFSDMTSNIGKFTNAGVKLDVAVNAIKGVSNVAALSGANAQEASRAMYNFSQALSAGYVKLIDWKSIENANMATVGFKEQLLEAAVAAGTVTKTVDGMYKVLSTNANGSTMEMAIDATHNFNDSLSYQWMTTEVLTKTLGDYANAETEIGKKAFQAATEIKTFSMLFDTLKEAAQSGWAQTWELLAGDFEEAKALWTKLGEVIGGFIDKSASARNSLIKTWKDLGGRQDLIDSLMNIINAITNIVQPIKEAFRDIFPPVTAERIKAITGNLSEFTKEVKFLTVVFGAGENTFDGYVKILSSQYGELPQIAKDVSIKVKTFLKGFFSIFKTIGSVVKQLLPIVGKIVSFIRPIGSAIVNLSEKLGLFLLKINETVSKTDIFRKAVDKISEAFDKLSTFIQNNIHFTDLFNKAVEKLSAIGEKVKVIFGKIKEVVKNAISQLDIPKGMFRPENIFDVGLLSLIAVKLTQFIDKAKESLGDLSSIKDTLKDVFGGVKEYVNSLTRSTNAEALKKLATGLAILAGSLLVLSLIPKEKINSSLRAMAGAIIELMGTFYIFNQLSGGTKKAIKSIGLVVALASALFIMAGALKMVSSLTDDEMKIGLQTLFGILGELALFMTAIDFKKIGAGSGLGLIGLATSLLIMVGVIKILGNLEISEILQGLSTMVIALEAVAVATSQMPSNMLAVGAGVVLVSAALVIMSGALIALGKVMNHDESVRALVVLGLGLAALAVALVAMEDAIPGAFALTIASAAILLFTPAMIALSKMDGEGIAKSLGMLAGTLLILGVAAGVMGPLLPVMLGLSGTILLLGVGTLAAGIGLTAVAAGITAIAGALSVGGSLITKGLEVIILGFVNLIPKVVESLLSHSAQIVTLAYFLIATFCHGVNLAIPQIINSAFGVIVALLTGIRDNLGQIVTVVGEIIVIFLNTLATQLPLIVQAGMNFILSFINGIAEAIRGNSEPLYEAFRNLLSSLIELLLGGLSDLVSYIPGIGDLLGDKISGWKDDVRDWLAPESYAEAGKEAASATVKGFESKETEAEEAGGKIGEFTINGMTSQLGLFKESGTELSDETIESFMSGDYMQSGGYAGSGFSSGVLSKWQACYNSGYSLGSATNQGYTNALAIKSPSRVGMKSGGFFGQGVILGLKGMTKNVYNEGYAMGDASVDGLKKSMNRISEIISSDISEQPTIRPIIDLSDIKSKSKSIGDLLNSNASIKPTTESLSGSVSRNVGTQVSATNTKVSGNSGTFSNVFNINGANDPKAVANEVSSILQHQFERKVSVWA